MRSKKFFTIASIVSMAMVLASLMCGFIRDGWDYYGYYYSYYSYAGLAPELYWPLFGLVMAYIVFGIIAIACYNVRIKGFLVTSFVLTFVSYAFATVVGVDAIIYENVTFGIILLSTAVGVALPLHLVAEIFALIAYKKKATETQPISAVCAAAPARNEAVEMLKQLKELYDDGVLTEEEYNEKRQQYVSQI